MAARSTSQRLLYLVAPWLVIAAVLALWEFAVRYHGIQPIFLPAPSSILKYLIAMIADGSLPYHLSVTFLRIIAGFLVAGVTGIIIGILMGMSPLVARIVDPWIAALYPLPKISLIPLLIIWLGTGETYKIVISAVTAFFPIAISTFSAIRQVDSGLIKAAKDLGANARQIQLKVVIPAALPGITSGLQLGMGVTIIMVVAAEMIGGSSDSGMGFLLIHAGQVMETEKVFAGLIALAVFGAVITNVQKWLDRLVAPWTEKEH
jgi:ABC-type nitrate/sulfonate/bicarbonate transport system permease component